MRQFLPFFLILSILAMSCRLTSFLPSETTSESEQQQSEREQFDTVISQSSEVTMLLDEQEVQVVLNPYSQQDTTNIAITAIDLGDNYLIETVDPKGRYLPTAQIVPKNDQPFQKILAPQFDISLEWSLRHVGTLNVEPLMTKPLGTTSLGSLHEFLAAHSFVNGVNILMPAPSSLDEAQQLNVYQTLAPATILVLPIKAGAWKVPGLAVPAPDLLIGAMIFVYLASLTIPLIFYLQDAQDVAVPDLVGKTKEDINQLQAEASARALAQGGLAGDAVSLKVDFMYKYISTTCGSSNQVGTIVAQNPPPGTKINALNEEIALQICEKLVAETPTSTPTPTFTHTPQSITSDTLPTRTPTPLPIPTETPNSDLVVNNAVLVPDFYARYQCIKNEWRNVYFGVIEAGAPSCVDGICDYEDAVSGLVSEVDESGCKQDDSYEIKLQELKGERALFTEIRGDGRTKDNLSLSNYFLIPLGQTFKDELYIPIAHCEPPPFEYRPGRKEIIQIAGQTVEAVIYEIEQTVYCDWSETEAGTSITILAQDIHYYDSFSGLELRTELTQTVIGCTNCAPSLPGQTVRREVRELMETNQPFTTR